MRIYMYVVGGRHVYLRNGKRNFPSSAHINNKTLYVDNHMLGRQYFLPSLVDLILDLAVYSILFKEVTNGETVPNSLPRQQTVRTSEHTCLTDNSPYIYTYIHTLIGICVL